LQAIKLECRFLFLVITLEGLADAFRAAEFLDVVVSGLRAIINCFFFTGLFLADRGLRE
jgi:hypothetical protein